MRVLSTPWPSTLQAAARDALLWKIWLQKVVPQKCAFQFLLVKATVVFEMGYSKSQNRCRTEVMSASRPGFHVAANNSSTEKSKDLGGPGALIVLEPQVNTFRLVLTPFRCGSLSPSTASVWGAKMEDTQMEKAILMVKMIMNYGIPWESMGFFMFFRVSYRHSELQGTWSPPLCHRSTTSPPKRAWPRR